MADTILVIEDDPNIAELIRLYLTNHGYKVDIINDGRMALNLWHKLNPALVILDIMLPQVNGLEICHSIRTVGKTPVIIVTAKGALGDKLQGFDLGADDYLVKPFDPLELLARVKAILRRSHEDDDKLKKVSLAGLYVDIGGYYVEVSGQPVELTKKETELLFHLVANPGRVFTREYLLQHLWGYNYPGGTRTVDVHINRLRDKMAPYNLPWRIRTLWGVGYKLDKVSD